MLITIGAILGIVGWVQIKNLGHVRRILMAHMVIGLILFGFVLIQVSAALARPSHKSNLRCSRHSRNAKLFVSINHSLA